MSYEQRFTAYLSLLERRKMEKEKAMVKVQQRGLGKGLSALISENYANTPAAPAAKADAPASGGVQELKHGLIVPGKFQPRTRFSDEQLNELAVSIRKNGIMQPIIVRPVWRDGKAAYEIVAGERRWRAAGIAGLEAIPAIVREISDQQALELALIENVQRADLTPLEEAAGYQRLLEEFSYTQDELSSVVGKSRSHIANLLRLLTLPVEIKTLMDEGKLSMGHARALLNAKNATEIAQMAVAKDLSVRQVEALARGGIPQPGQGTSRASQPRAHAPRSGNADAPKDPDIIGLEMTISESLGMSVSIDDRGQSGEVVIIYESLTQLDELLRRLGGSV